MAGTNVNTETFASTDTNNYWIPSDLGPNYNYGPFLMDKGIVFVFESASATQFVANVVIAHISKYPEGNFFTALNGPIRPGTDTIGDLQSYYSAFTHGDVIYIASYVNSTQYIIHITQIQLDNTDLDYTIVNGPAGPTNQKFGSIQTHAPWMQRLSTGKILCMIDHLDNTSIIRMEESIYDPVVNSWDSTEDQLYTGSDIDSQYNSDHSASSSYKNTFHLLLSTDDDHLHLIGMTFDSTGIQNRVLMYAKIERSTGSIITTKQIDVDLYLDDTFHDEVGPLQDYTNSEGNREFIFSYIKATASSGYAGNKYMVAKITIDSNDDATITTEEIFAPSGTIQSHDPSSQLGPLTSVCPWGENNENYICFYVVEDTDKGNETAIYYRRKKDGTLEDAVEFKKIDYMLDSSTGVEGMGYGQPRCGKVGDYKIGLFYSGDNPTLKTQENDNLGTWFYDMLDFTPEPGEGDENSAWID